jgi:biotin-(acetyl-CoA carboxylase) ligase
MIPHALHGLTFVERFYSHDTIDSTHITACRFSRVPRKGSLFVIQADNQNECKFITTDLRGCPPGAGLWASLIIGSNKLSDPFSLNCIMQTALCQTLQKVIAQLSFYILWPDFILCNDTITGYTYTDRNSINSSLSVLSFGLYVNFDPAPLSEGANPANTSLFLETGCHYSKSILLRTTIETFYDLYNKDESEIHDLYNNLLYKKGAQVAINGQTGVFNGVDMRGNIIIDQDPLPDTHKTHLLHYL